MTEAELGEKIQRIVEGIYATGHDYGMHEAFVPEQFFDMWKREIMQEVYTYIEEKHEWEMMGKSCDECTHSDRLHDDNGACWDCQKGDPKGCQ